MRRATPRPARPGLRADIQGLRAVAVAAVLLDHTGIPGFAGGFTGVDVFFVISGFLITGHLLRERAERGRIAFPAFYARRARRLLPAALTVVAATVAAALLLMSPLRIAGVAQDAIATALYAPNLRFAILQTDYLAGSEPSPFQHYWSLGVEEQFYLLWPLLLAALAALAARPWARRLTTHGVVAGVAVLGAASFALCLALAQVSQPWAFFSLPTRAWELAAGALVACAATAPARVPRVIGAVGAWAGLVAILGGIVLLDGRAGWPGPLALVPVLGTAAVIGLGPSAGPLGPERALSPAPLQWTGRVSYSLYLVHWPLVVLAAERLSPVGALPLWAGAAIVIVSPALAWMLHRFVEEPLRRPRALATSEPRAHRRTLLAMAATSLVVAAVAGGAGSAVAAQPIAVSRAAPDGPLGRLPAGTPYVPSNLAPTILGAAADTGEIYANGCQQSKSAAELITCDFGAESGSTRIALFGDSHAGRLFPALERVAEEAGARLTTVTKSGCRSIDTVAAWAGSDADCTAWRDAALAALAADPPDVVVIADHIGPMPGRDPAAVQRDWEEGIEAVLAELSSETVPVLVQDNPELPFSAPQCLARHVQDAGRCAVPREEALNPAVRAAIGAVAARTRAEVVDLTDAMCNAATCPAIIGATLVYSDEHHLTATFGAALAAPLGEALSPILRQATG